MSLLDTFTLTIVSFYVTSRAILLVLGTSTGDGRLVEQVRFPRARLVTSHSGGPGIVSAGMMTGARGAPLKRDRWRG
jgi:hypothetical protein